MEAIYTERKTAVLGELWRMNRNTKWRGSVIQRVNEGEGQTGWAVCDRERQRGRESERKCVTGNNGWEVEGPSGCEQEKACDWGVVAEIGGTDERTSGWDNKRKWNEWVRILWTSDSLSKWTNCYTNKWVICVLVWTEDVPAHESACGQMNEWGMMEETK